MLTPDDEKIFYTHSDFQKDITQTLDLIKEKNITDIVAIYRGSLPFGVVLSNRSGLPLTIVEFQTRDGDSKIPSIVINKLRGNNVLIVDDIIDTGKTLKEVLKLFENKNVTLKTLVKARHYNGDLETHSTFVTDKWVVFEDWE